MLDAPGPARAVRLDQARIIVIDDHEDLVENLQEILEDQGATVRTASNASAGLALAREGFDVALVDVRLPDARGPLIVPQLKESDGLQEVLLVTGHASMQDAIEAVKAGAFAYVLKPFDSEELIANVGRALDRVRLRRGSVELQRKLEQSEAALRTMVDTVQALLLVLDADCIVRQANPAVAVATGKPLDEIIGQNWVETFVPPREQADVLAKYRSVGHGTSVGLESFVVRYGPNGLEERSVSWQLSGLQVDDELRLYASGLDVSEFRDLERRTRLAEKLAAVGTISAGLAHEIRNPLNAASLQLLLLVRSFV
jgi:PAS domain S-box-containing protein